MQRIFLFLISVFTFTTMQAQSTDSSRAVQVGDSVNISACPSKGFTYIQ
ncbi:MAG: hypothetical protein R2852_02155 [Bacteroidia bacterium]